jgi:hypothetical protein
MYYVISRKEEGCSVEKEEWRREDMYTQEEEERV